MMTLAEFVAKHEITLTQREAVRNPFLRNPDFVARHFDCTLHRGNYTLFVPLSIGLGRDICPTPEIVLDAMAVAAVYIEASKNYEGWIELLGRQHIDIPPSAYELYRAQTQELKDFLGEEAYLELLLNTIKITPR